MLEGGAEMGFAKIAQENPWLATTPLVVKPDQLIKRRGKAGLLAVNKTWPEVQAWVSERMGKNQQVLLQRLTFWYATFLLRVLVHYVTGIFLLSKARYFQYVDKQISST